MQSSSLQESSLVYLSHWAVLRERYNAHVYTCVWIDQFILALTGYRRESFVFNKVVMPGKEGVEVIISILT